MTDSLRKEARDTKAVISHTGIGINPSVGRKAHDLLDKETLELVSQYAIFACENGPYDYIFELQRWLVEKVNFSPSVKVVPARGEEALCYATRVLSQCGVSFPSPKAWFTRLFGISPGVFTKRSDSLGSGWKSITLAVRLSWCNYCITGGLPRMGQVSIRWNRYCIRRVLRSSAKALKRNLQVYPVA